MPDTIADLIKARFGLAEDTGKDRPADGVAAHLLSHRSNRRYKPDAIPAETLRIVLAAACSAPAKSDLQQSAIIRATPEQQARVVELLPSMAWIGEASEFLLICGDSRRARRMCEARGVPFGHEATDAFMNAAVDTALVMGWLIAAAEGEGLGTCPISGVRGPIDEIAELFGLPDLVFPVAGLTVGWPADDPPTRMRLPLSTFIHEGTYDDAHLIDDLDAYDRRRREAEPPKHDGQRMEAEYGRVDFYGWSDDKARQISIHDRPRFGPFVRERGFKL